MFLRRLRLAFLVMTAIISVTEIGIGINNAFANKVPVDGLTPVCNTCVDSCGPLQHNQFYLGSPRPTVVRCCLDLGDPDSIAHCCMVDRYHRDLYESVQRPGSPPDGWIDFWIGDCDAHDWPTATPILPLLRCN